MYLFNMQMTKVMMVHSIAVTRTPSGMPTATPTVVTWPLEMDCAIPTWEGVEGLEVVRDIATEMVVKVAMEMVGMVPAGMDVVVVGVVRPVQSHYCMDIQ